MADARAPGVRRGTAAGPPGVLTDLWVFMARRFDQADPAGVLAELLIALRVRAALSEGYVPPRRKRTAPSAAAVALAAEIEKAVCYCLAAADEAASPSVLPGDLEVRDDEVGADLQTGASSVPEEITLEEAAVVLGFRSVERVRQLVRAGEIDGYQDATGKRQWHARRPSVIAYRGRSGDGAGGGTKRRIA